jgi:hypothetical protein
MHQDEDQDGSGFLSISCSNKLKTNEGCVIDLNSKINRNAGRRESMLQGEQ